MGQTHDTVIRNGQIVTPTGVLHGDLAVRSGQISAIGPDLGPGTEEFDAQDRFVLPGGVDPHAHIEQMSGMGVMNADTFETATASAALGGTTSVISFAAQQKGARLADTVSDYAARAARGARIDYAFHLSLSDPEAPSFGADLAALIAEGHRSLKVFTTYNIAIDDHGILSALAAARAHGALVCVHAENDGLIQWARSALLDTGQVRPYHHALSRPRLAEIEAVARLCRFAEFFGHPVMLFHISTAEAVAEIARAQSRGVPVWAETCPHYLLMTDAVLDQPGLEGAKWMCSPPQRTEQDQQALWTALQDGVIRVISSDHAPYRFDDSGKLSAGPQARFDQIANGLPGLQTRLPLLFDAMVQPDGTGLMAFADATSHQPARIYGLQRKGQLSVGMDADVVVWNPQAEMTYGDNDLSDNVGYNPWSGRRVRGLPDVVFARGERIVEQGQLTAAPGRGAWIPRAEIGVAGTPPAPELQQIEAGTP